MLNLKNIDIKRGNKTVLQLSHLDIDDIGLTVILGHNGSGKSTLLKAMARQIKPRYGEILFRGQALSALSQRELAQNIAYLPQSLPDALSLTAKEVVEMGRFPWHGTLGRMSSQDKLAVFQAMQATQIQDFSDVLVSELSGGERQRVWVAMLLAQATSLMLLDEPTSALDVSHQYEVMQLLKRIQIEQKKSIVVVLHDINLAARFADRILALHQGTIVFDGSPCTLLDCHRLTELYGVDIDVITHPKSKIKIAVVA